MSQLVVIGDLTLRDVFAAFALQAYLANVAQFDEPIDADLAARAAFVYADAMLKERE